jgi:putative sterol carrier protein
MPHLFPSQVWIEAVGDQLNQDADYARIAHAWEGDLSIVMQPSGALKEQTTLYWDLWHGKCREARILPLGEEISAGFVLTATFDVVSHVLNGTLDPVQALMTRKLHVQGNLAYMMRNIPTVIAFVRTARSVPFEIIS